MRQREPAKGKLGGEGLYLHEGIDVAAGRVAVVSDRDVAAQFPHLRRIGAEVVTDMTKRAMRVEIRAVESHNAGCFLPAMLQSVQAKCRQYTCLVAAEHPENPAFFMEAVKLFGSVIRWGGAVRHRHVGLLFSKNEINLISSDNDKVIGQFPRQIKRPLSLAGLAISPSRLQKVPVPMHPLRQESHPPPEFRLWARLGPAGCR